jgi:hypothetical protein
MEGKSLIKVFKTNSFLIVEYTVQFIPWTKTKLAKISKSFLIISDPRVYMGVSYVDIREWTTGI